MNPQRNATWSIGNMQGSIISNKPDGILVEGATGRDTENFYGGPLVCESIQKEVAEMIIADHEFCKSLTETDRDNLCDIVWWLKGYQVGSKDNFEQCPFTEYHLKTLDGLVKSMRSVIK